MFSLYIIFYDFMFAYSVVIMLALFILLIYWELSSVVNIIMVYIIQRKLDNILSTVHFDHDYFDLK